MVVFFLPRGKKQVKTNEFSQNLLTKPILFTFLKNLIKQKSKNVQTTDSSNMQFLLFDTVLVKN